MNKKFAITIGVIFLIVIIGIAIIGVEFGFNLVSIPTQSQQPTTPNPQPSPQPSSQVKEFTVHGKSFSFTPNSITVNKGDTVKITFISDDTSHDICVEGGYGCSQVVSGGGTSNLEFVAKDTANLKFFCSVDGHRTFGMEGSLLVQ